MELASLIIIGFAAVISNCGGSIKITTIILADQTIRKDKVFASLISMPIAAVIILNVPQDIISKTFWLVMAAAFIMSQVALYKSITGLFAARHKLRETQVVRTVYVDKPEHSHNCVATKCALPYRV